MNSSAVSINSMQFAWQGMAQSAYQIASAGTTARDSGADINAAVAGSFNTAEPMVNMKVNLHLFNASAKVFDAADSMIGSLLDVRA
jgi:uncharacterized protein YukE